MVFQTGPEQDAYRSRQFVSHFPVSHITESFSAMQNQIDAQTKADPVKTNPEQIVTIIENGDPIT